MGSVVGLTDAAGNLVDNTRYRYEPYGKQLDGPSSVQNPWRFTGAYFDSDTGFYKMGTRYYDPNVGRWTQPDPDRGNLSDPLSLNAYLYVADNPTNLSDPTGRCHTYTTGFNWWSCLQQHVNEHPLGDVLRGAIYRAANTIVNFGRPIARELWTLLRSTVCYYTKARFC